ncbi:hypothetical protein AB4097_07795 [Microvirga sp. 2MCAF35]|uniref:hypothetical protein n=1 Tax=Microvirga sp. 2MCAF35 TaxID=3232987 RepID=UPI003F9E7F85
MQRREAGVSRDIAAGDVCLLVITGLVPVISLLESAENFRIEMAGTRPAMTWWDIRMR